MVDLFTFFCVLITIIGAFRIIKSRESIERRHTVCQMYAESNVTCCISVHANSKLMTDTGSHVTLRIHLMYSMPTFDTLFSIIYSWYNYYKALSG